MQKRTFFNSADSYKKQRENQRVKAKIKRRKFKKEELKKLISKLEDLRIADIISSKLTLSNQK